MNRYNQFMKGFGWGTDQNQEKQHLNNDHCSYFENLEHRLLKESDKLTHLMGKSLIDIQPKLKLRSATSLSRRQFTNSIAHIRNSAKSQQQPQTTTRQRSSMRRVKELCEKLRLPKRQLQNAKSPGKVHLAEKEETHRKIAYNLYNFAGHPQTQVCKNIPQKPKEKTRTQKWKKICKVINEVHSLKDTVSTQSVKSRSSAGEKSSAPKVKLDDFSVLKYLAEGKFGSVYLVKHKTTGFLCALKRIPNFTAWKDPKIINQRIREIKIQSFLDHPHIVQLYSVFAQQNDLYLLMEFCCSGTLYAELRGQGHFHEEKIRETIRQICYAVEFMHDNDILHRDLKPENVLFHECVVKICDFGWSVNSPLLRDTLCGTPLYSSPEIVQKQQYDNKVDIWNIGILTYELLYGKVPFQIRSEDELTKIVDQDIYFPRNKPASTEIKDFILHCLSKDPKERFDIAKLLDHRFLHPQNY